MSANSRRKGAAGEREFAARVLELTGVRLIRQLDQCRGGGHDLEPEAGHTSDTARALRRFAIEVKRRRTITDADVTRWWTTEAVPQADAARLAPALAYRADRSPWRVVVPLRTLAPTLPDMRATLKLEPFVELLRGDTHG